MEDILVFVFAFVFLLIIAMIVLFGNSNKDPIEKLQSKIEGKELPPAEQMNSLFLQLLMDQVHYTRLIWRFLLFIFIVSLIASLVFLLFWFFSANCFKTTSFPDVVFLCSEISIFEATHNNRRFGIRTARGRVGGSPIYNRLLCVKHPRVFL